jgi:hypothetical protein
MKRLKNNIQNLIDAIYEQSAVGGPLCSVLERRDFKDETINRCVRVTIPICDDIVLKLLCNECAKLLLELPLEERNF